MNKIYLLADTHFGHDNLIIAAGCFTMTSVWLLSEVAILLWGETITTLKRHEKINQAGISLSPNTWYHEFIIGKDIDAPQEHTEEQNEN
jgi:hypothetical protein